MKKSLGAILLGLTLAVSAAGQNAQNKNTGQNPPEAPNIHVRVNLVNVLFTVTNNKKHLVPNLKKSDFRVFEDKQPQKILFFSSESNLPLRVGVLIDTSNSVRERLPFEQDAAIDFLSNILRPERDAAFVVGFDVEPVMVQDYTGEVGKLSAAIRQLQAGGGTGLFDAIYYACKEKMIYVPAPQPYLRRVLIVFSDGQDNYSQHSFEEALAMAQRAEAIIFAISTDWSGMGGRGDRVLKRLAEETGGQAFFPIQAGDLAGNFQRIAHELRSQYSLAYVSTNTAHDGTFRRIAIKPDKKSLRVQAKAGYFAPAQ